MGVCFSAASALPAALFSSFCLLFQGITCACSTASFLSCLFRSATGSKTGISAQTAKLFYIVLFGLTMFVAILLRFQGNWLTFGAFAHLCRSAHPSSFATVMADYFFGADEESCNKGIEAVYRLSFSMTMFFALLFLFALVSPKIHRGFWFLKLFLLYLPLLLLSTFLESFSSSQFANVSRVGGTCFLVLQIIFIIDFSYQVNELLVERDYLVAALGLSVALLITALGGVVSLFVLYGECTEGVVFTSLTLCMSTALVLLSVFRHRLGVDKEEGTLLPTAAVIVYGVYLCWSALESNYVQCRSGSAPERETTVSIVLGALWTTACLMWTAVSVSTNAIKLVAGGDGNSEDDVELASGGRPLYSRHLEAGENGEEEEEEEDNTPVWPFYLMMMFASMYLGMMLTDWGRGIYDDDEKAHDVASMWVKICAQWVTLVLFAWTLVAPAVLTDREF